MLVFLRCLCVWVSGVFVGVCACGSGMLICFVSALGSHEMGRHKLPIIIIIIIIIIKTKTVESLGTQGKTHSNWTSRKMRGGGVVVVVMLSEGGGS